MALDPSIVLLIGADTSVVDESSYARTLTLVGNAARTTAQAKYGAGSITFDGAGDRVQAADSNDFNLAAGDFTLEGWFRFVTKTTDQALCGQWGFGGTDSSYFLNNAGGNLIFSWNNGAGTLQAAFAVTLGQWYHLAVDRQGSTLRLYINGAVVATNAAFAVTLTDSIQPFTLGTIGVTSSFPAYDFNGQMDEIRVTKGVAQYHGAFTPPTGPFPRDSFVTVPNVVGLTESAAQSALTGVGLTLAPHTQAPSASPVGQVLAQSPAAGASVALGTAVQLQISRGAKAWTSARSGIARSGATRSNYVFPEVPGVVVIGGADYTARILNGSLQVHLEINDKPDTCSFQAYINNEQTQAQIAVGVDVVIGLTTPAASNPIFGGQIVQVQTTRNPASIDSLASVLCADYLQIVDSQYLITYGWPAQSATTTILDLVARFVNRPGFPLVLSTAGVQTGLPSHQAFGVIGERFSTVLRRMVTMFPTPGGFYIDAGKVLRVWTGKPEPGHTQPTAFTLANPHLKQFADLVDSTPVRDAVIVEGVQTSAPLGTPPAGDYAATPGAITFPVLDASILGRVTDEPGREIRVGNQRYVMRYANGPWTPPDNSPTASDIGATVPYNPTAGGDVVVSVTNASFLFGRARPCWVKVGEQLLLVKSTGGSLINIARTGFGAQVAPILAGSLMTAIDSLGGGSVTGRYDLPGNPEAVRAQPIDADVVMVVRSVAAPALHENMVQDGRYVISGATNRGSHEVNDFKNPATSIQFETTDTNALPGRVQSYSFVDPPLVTSAGDYMILTTDITWPVWGELPLRTCTAANIGAADIVDAWLVDPR